MVLYFINFYYNRGFNNLENKSIKKVDESIENIVTKIKNGDTFLRNEFIKKYNPFIIKSIYEVTGRYIEKENDEELSVGLLAFNEAIDRYNKDRDCTFLSYSNIVIRSRIIDYIRKNKKEKNIYPISALENSVERNYNDICFKNGNYEIEKAEIRDELMQIKDDLSDFGITLKDLVYSSPKHQDSKKLCIKIAKVLLDNNKEYNKFLKKKKLPRLFLTKNAKVNKSTIEKNRKYIIAIVLILRSNLDNIKSYIEHI
jgi:RNA polymerase sigma factor